MTAKDDAVVCKWAVVLLAVTGRFLLRVPPAQESSKIRPARTVDCRSVELVVLVLVVVGSRGRHRRPMLLVILLLTALLSEDICSRERCWFYIVMRERERYKIQYRHYIRDQRKRETRNDVVVDHTVIALIITATKNEILAIEWM